MKKVNCHCQGCDSLKTYKNKWVERTAATATLSDILHSFGQGNFTLIWEKSGNFENSYLLMSVATMCKCFCSCDHNSVISYEDLTGGFHIMYIYLGLALL